MDMTHTNRCRKEQEVAWGEMDKANQLIINTKFIINSIVNQEDKFHHHQKHTAGWHK